MKCTCKLCLATLAKITKSHVKIKQHLEKFVVNYFETHSKKKDMFGQVFIKLVMDIQKNPGLEDVCLECLQMSTFLVIRIPLKDRD